MSTSLPSFLGMAPSADAAEFFAGLARGEVLVQRCAACARARLPRTVACPSCGAPDSTWEPAPGPVRLHSYTVVHRAPTDDFRELAPYGIGLLDLGPGCRLLAHLAWSPAPADVDAEVDLRVEPVGDRARLVAHRTGPPADRPTSRTADPGDDTRPPDPGADP